MTPGEREKALSWRKQHQRPWHSPPHVESGRRSYLITAACYEHVPVIGGGSNRLSSFTETLLATLDAIVAGVTAWVVLPNHYHVITLCDEVKPVLEALGQLHGRTSHDWNGEDKKRGRKVWHGAAEKAIQNSAHHWASINYVHHNPVKHGYVDKWDEWPWSSAADYLESMRREEATQIWKAYPVDRYGEGWDD